MTLKQFKHALRWRKFVGAYCGSSVVWVSKRAAIEWFKDCDKLKGVNKVSVTDAAVFIGSPIGEEITKQVTG